MYEQIVEHRKRLLVDIEHYKGTIQVQANKIEELTIDKKLLYEDLQKARNENVKLYQEIEKLSALISAKPL